MPVSSTQGLHLIKGQHEELSLQFHSEIYFTIAVHAINIAPSTVFWSPVSLDKNQTDFGILSKNIGSLSPRCSAIPINQSLAHICTKSLLRSNEIHATTLSPFTIRIANKLSYFSQFFSHIDDHKFINFDFKQKTYLMTTYLQDACIREYGVGGYRMVLAKSGPSILINF